MTEIMQLSFEEALVYIPLGILLTVLAAIAIKIGVQFDINRYMEFRREKIRRKIQTLCPHAYLAISESGEESIESSFHSPFGAYFWECSTCGIKTHSKSVPTKIMLEWTRDPDGLMKCTEEFNREFRKHYG